MTTPIPTHTHIWDGSRALPDWLTGHRWEDGQLVIRTPDGDTRPQAGWWFIAWSDGSVTVASPTSGERVYGDGGMADRLAHAETALARQAQETATWRATANTLDAGGPGTPRNRAEQAEQRLARVQRLLDSGPIGACCDRLVRAALDARPAATQATEPATWTPPPPGDTREQLPDHLLALIRGSIPDYTSTACVTADTLAVAVHWSHPRRAEVGQWAERLHQRCRRNQKFTGQLCACGCH